MNINTTSVAGIEIPSTDLLFLAVLGVHISLGLACALVGAFAMLSKKERPPLEARNDLFLVLARASHVGDTPVRDALERELSFVCPRDLLVCGRVVRAQCTSSASTALGETAHHRNGSFLRLMLVAFYVDNGKQLPLWKELPHFPYWLLPLLVGIPLIVRMLLWHPLAQEPTQ